MVQTNRKVVYTGLCILTDAAKGDVSMGTIIDYVKEYGCYTFEEKPLNEVDSLILSQFSYLKFDGLVPGLSEHKKAVSIGYLNQHEEKDKLFADKRFAEHNYALFTAMCNSFRFGKMRMNYYVNEIDLEKEVQFSAITFYLGKGCTYVAYRGTDETIVGWKEDFNMAFLAPVPGQLRSVAYMKKMAWRIRGRFYVGGHSKGGNLAVYAAMNCPPRLQKRMVEVYSHDGPGFRPEILESADFERIQEKVHKIVPHSSMVGMLLQSQENHTIIESTSYGLLQHDPFTWIVEKDRFKEVDKIYESRLFMDKTLNEWILSMDEEEIQFFVDTLYQIISAAEIDNLIDFTDNWKENLNALIEAVKELDDVSKQMMKQIIRSLFELLSFRTGQEIRRKSGAWMEKIKRRSHEKRRLKLTHKE